MTRFIHPIGPARKLLFAGSNPNGSSLLAPVEGKIPDDFLGTLGEAGAESIEKGCQHLGPRNGSATGLAQGDRRGPEFAGKVGGLLGKIQAEAEDRQGQMAGSGDGLHEKTRKLPVFYEEIVGPLQKGLEPGQATDGVRRRQRSDYRKKRKQGCGWFQQDGAPEAEGVIRGPLMPLASPAGGLDFGGPDRGDFLRFAGKILGGASGRQNMGPTSETMIRWQKGIDERRRKRVGWHRPSGVGFRGRNCRKS